MNRFAFTAAFAASFALTSAASAQSSAIFGDWSARCDNVLRCAAIGFAKELGGGWLHFERDGAATAQARIRIVLDTESKDDTVAVSVKFDEPGFETIFPASVQAKRDDSERHVIVVPDGAMDAFRNALRKASQIVVRRTDGQKIAYDTDELNLSLKGSVATLRWIDERQRRVNTVTAMIASGPAAATTIPSPPALPSIRKSRFVAKELGEKAPPAVMAAWKEACDEWDEVGDRKGSGYLIGAQAQLWDMPCSRGAYNFGSMFFLQQGNKAQLLKFEQWMRGEQRSAGRFETKAEELINAEFVPADMQIIFFSKGRGIGDCGSGGGYTWDGSRFRMTAYRELDECRGVPEDFWLTLWRTNVIK